MDWIETKELLRGPAALVMTPFHQDLSLNLEALTQNIRYMTDAGLRRGRGFLVVPCGTGEYVSLTRDEHRQMVETAVRATDGTVPVVAGVGTCSCLDAAEMARIAQRAGACCVMVPAPFYYELDEEVFFNWYATLAQAVTIPIMVYDQVFRRASLGAGLRLQGIARLAEISSLIAFKYGGPAQHLDMVPALEQFSGRFAFIHGSPDFTSVISHMHGAYGFVSAPVTCWPAFELHYWDLLEARQYHEAAKWQARLAPYTRLFSREGGWGQYLFAAAVIKATLEYVGLYGGPVRPPFYDLAADQKEKLFALLDSLAL